MASSSPSPDAVRATFREKQPDVCWQRRLRDARLGEGSPLPPEALVLKRSVVRPISRRMAEQIIHQYEWLGTMATITLHYGIFWDDHCAGVACVGLGASMAGAYHHIQFGIERDALCTLARGACVHWAPPGTNSRLVSVVCRLLGKQRRWKLIWATSDTDAGEVGTIYQACNWTYIGTSQRNRENEVIAPNGRILNIRVLTSYARRYKTTFSEIRKLMLEQGWRFQSSNPKHRYVWILDREDEVLARRIKEMQQPYPKRAGSITVDAPDHQSGEGGPTPTPALHTENDDAAGT